MPDTHPHTSKEGFIKIGGACLNQTPIDWKNNFENIVDTISSAKKGEVKILCLPELCITGYGCEDLFLSDWVSEKALSLLYQIVPFCENIAVAVGLPLVFDGKVYNTACLIQNKEIKGFYAKQFLANDGVHYEKRWFTAWEQGHNVDINLQGKAYPLGDITFDLYGVKTGFEICEDAWHHDRPACRLYEKGIQLILNPSASHFSFGKNKIREELVRSSSKNFECYYMYVNLLGNQSGRIIYDGDILIANRGELIGRNKRLSFHKFNLLACEINSDNKTHVPNVEEDWNGKNIEFTRATSLGFFDYLRKSRTKGFTLSLSGGADSSSIAVLVAEMVRNGVENLGEEVFLKNLNLTNLNFDSEKRTERNQIIVGQLLTTAYQGTKNSSKDTFESAQELAKSIGAIFYNWNIDNIVKENTDIIQNAIDRKLEWTNDDIALQNIQARSRSPIIWMLANIKGQILLTTSNRSEGDVGYTTMDGDTSGSFAPIAGVDKEFILDWLKYAEKELGYVGLKAVNSLSPSAELRPSNMDQTDESDLMPYPVLRSIEYFAIRNHQSPKATFKAVKSEFEIDSEVLKGYVRKFFRLWSINQWKRERLAPSFHLDDFNVDPKTWCRFPILSGSFKEELKDL
ncbi:nitrilase-related carbon-nitrogen hydrolase [Reichenbachiella sp. MALMAid0571]|uniref:NAD(+) synthase n=1 Tax=Reichenbachiella sp. MALMAid0571 TaxID=3143939 RepID=UPI0032E04DC3